MKKEEKENPKKGREREKKKIRKIRGRRIGRKEAQREK